MNKVLDGNPICLKRIYYEEDMKLVTHYKGCIRDQLMVYCLSAANLGYSLSLSHNYNFLQ